MLQVKKFTAALTVAFGNYAKVFNAKRLTRKKAGDTTKWNTTPAFSQKKKKMRVCQQSTIYFINSSKELSAYITSRLKNGEKNIIAKLKNVSNAANIFGKVMGTAERQYINTLNQSVSAEVRYNPSLMVFEINYN